MAWRGWDLRSGLARERVADAATALLVIRVVEGLAAWLLFNEFFLGTAPLAWWVVPSAFITYLILNLAVTLYYRAGRISTPLLIIDVLTNVAPLILPLAASGGLASPLLLLFLVKAMVYVLVFNARVAWLSLIATGVMLGMMVVLGRAGILPVVRYYEMPDLTTHGANRAAMLCLLVIGPLALAWLRYVVAAADRQIHAARRRDRADRGGMSAAVANTLLTLNQALGPLMRVDEVVRTVGRVAPRWLAADGCEFVLWDDTTKRYVAVPSADAISESGMMASRQSTAEDVKNFDWVRRLGHAAVVASPESAQSDSPSAAILLAPLTTGEQFGGVLRIERVDGRRLFTQREIALADGVARQTAIALARARRFEERWYLARAAESTDEAVLISDARGRVVFVNDACLRTLGYERADVVGRDALEFGGPNADWLAEATRQVRRHGWRAEVVAYRKDGVALPLVVHSSPIFAAEGGVEGTVTIAQDISAEKSIQDQLQRSDRLAAVGEMAAGIAHEINNALTAIFGQTDRLHQLDDRELRTAFERVDRQARRIADIVQGVMGFARPRSLRAEPVDLVAVTADTLDLIRHELQAVELETAFDPDLPPALADRQQVQQVLLNLLTNAAQAMAGREPMRLQVSVVGLEDHLAVRVADSGPGIPADVLPRIFDPFFSTKPQGTGLGLSVSYAIARAHGGELSVMSEPGRGTTFTLLLPIATVTEPARRRPALLVDDDDDVAQALGDMVAKEGFVVERVSTGFEALAKLAGGSWDVVFLDVRLPDLSGPDVFAQLQRTRPELAERVVFVTGGVWRSESRLREQLPSQPVLAKPCSQAQLREILRVLRDRRQAA